VELVTGDDGTGAVAAMRALADRHDLQGRAETSCRECLRTASADGDLDGLAAEKIRVVYERSALVFDHGVLGHPFVETRLGLYVDASEEWHRGLRPVGHYRLITLLDGTDEDDYLIMDKPMPAEPRAAPDGRE
jgi:hypothetical protein